MSWGSISASAVGGGCQAIAAIALFAAMAFAPPARGAVLLVPLTAQAASGMVQRAVAHGGLLLGRGPIRGSVVMFDKEGGLAAPLLRSGVLTLAAPSAFCGDVLSDGNKR